MTLPQASHAARIPNTTLSLPLELPSGTYAFETVDWFQSGIVITSPSDQANQLYIVERRGRIILISDVENWIRQAGAARIKRVEMPANNLAFVVSR